MTNENEQSPVLAVASGSVRPRCGNCQYWKRWDYNVGTCDQLTLGLRSGKTTEEHDRCRVYDDSDPISTEINFGCVHFSPNVEISHARERKGTQ